jgi:chromate reductase, NAD(P)H dehydrogenase (quinone)
VPEIAAANKQIIGQNPPPIVPEALLTISLLGKNLDAAGIVADAEISSQVKAAIGTFVTAIASQTFA